MAQSSAQMFLSRHPRLWYWAASGLSKKFRSLGKTASGMLNSFRGRVACASSAPFCFHVNGPENQHATRYFLSLLNLCFFVVTNEERNLERWRIACLKFGKGDRSFVLVTVRGGDSSRASTFLNRWGERLLLGPAEQEGSLLANAKDHGIVLTDIGRHASAIRSQLQILMITQSAYHRSVAERRRYALIANSAG